MLILSFLPFSLNQLLNICILYGYLDELGEEGKCLSGSINQLDLPLLQFIFLYALLMENGVGLFSS